MNKIKGSIIIVIGIMWFLFVYNFDGIKARPTAFGAKAIIGFVMGVVMIINGVRICRRK
jgi:hypothetical protein